MTKPAEERKPLDPRQPFSRTDLRAAGLSEDVLLSGRFHKVWWDTYVERGVRVTPQLRAKAALRLAPPTARISHHTAAELWGAPIPPDPHTHLTLPSAHKRLVRRGVRSHYGGGAARTWRGGVPVSSPQQTFVELAADGSWQRRFDLAYRGARIVIEYDGRQHAADTEQWNADIYRREELERAGWRVIVVTAEGIYREPERTLDRVRDALRQSDGVVLRRRYRPEWALHFPTRTSS